jgi:hypothetical protein
LLTGLPETPHRRLVALGNALTSLDEGETNMRCCRKFDIAGRVRRPICGGIGVGFDGVGPLPPVNIVAPCHLVRGDVVLGRLLACDGLGPRSRCGWPSACRGARSVPTLARPAETTVVGAGRAKRSRLEFCNSAQSRPITRIDPARLLQALERVVSLGVHAANRDRSVKIDSQYNRQQTLGKTYRPALRAHKGNPL